MAVKIYTTSTCPWCKKTKEFLKKNKIKFKEINVELNEKAAREMVEKSGQMGVPVIDIEGEIVVGFDEAKLKKLLKLK
jgi:glutaredoxin-like YruB-family protein